VTARRPKLQQFTFAEMKAALAGAKVGDTVRVSVDKRVEPTSYVVTYVNGDSLLVNGGRGSQRCLTYTQAEGVWLRKGPRGRRVVQAWVEADGRQAEPTQASTPTTVEISAHQFESLAIDVGGGSPDRVIGDVIEELQHLREENQRLHNLTVERHERDKVQAAVGRKLAEVERERDECRMALAQIRNVANGVVPGTSMLPSNTAPSLVVIEVTAALHRAVSSETRRPRQWSGADNYRRGIEVTLPERMHGEGPTQ
jgi:hypothetical protein